jgi:hypothetical protein
MLKNVRIQSAGILLLLGIATVGCGGPGINPQADAQHWADKIQPGISATAARQIMQANDFSPWSAGQIIYGYRDKLASTDNSDGVAMTVYLDDTGRVAYAQTYASTSSPYPMLWPTYP